MALRSARVPAATPNAAKAPRKTATAARPKATIVAVGWLRAMRPAVLPVTAIAARSEASAGTPASRNAAAPLTSFPKVGAVTVRGYDGLVSRTMAGRWLPACSAQRAQPKATVVLVRRRDHAQGVAAGAPREGRGGCHGGGGPEPAGESPKGPRPQH